MDEPAKGEFLKSLVVSVLLKKGTGHTACCMSPSTASDGKLVL